MTEEKNYTEYLEYTPIPSPLPEMKYFISIPAEIITASDMPVQRISCFYYLSKNMTKNETVMYSPIYMLQFCGYSGTWNRSNKNSVYENFISCMNWFLENKYITNFTREDFVGRRFQCSHVNVNKLTSPKHFGIVYDFEIESILNYKSSYKPLTSSILLLVLSYIRLYTWTRKSKIIGNSEKSKKEKPEIFHGKYNYIAEKLGLTARTTSKAIHALASLGFIAIRKLKRYKIFVDGSPIWQTNDTIFVTPYKFALNDNGSFVRLDKEEYDFEEEIKNGIEFVNKQNYISRKCKE